MERWYKDGANGYVHKTMRLATKEVGTSKKSNSPLELTKPSPAGNLLQTFSFQNWEGMALSGFLAICGNLLQ